METLEEYFDIVDENGIPTGETVSREIAHRDGIRHRTAHVWVIRPSDTGYEILPQKRSMEKDSFPGLYDTSSAGHISAGEEPLPSALRELYEELGIKAAAEEMHYAGSFRIQYEKEFHGHLFRDNEVAYVYVYQEPVEISDLVLQESEVEEVRWFGLDEVWDEIGHSRERFCVPAGGLKVLREYLKQYLKQNELKEVWKKEEDAAHIHGWDFSHIEGRYEEQDDLPWNYDTIVRQYLKKDMKLLDYDTGGGEYLLSLHHPYENTVATEGYPPNVKLCREVLTPLGIDLRECPDASAIPFPDQSFDMIINRHGDFDAQEIRRLLRPDGLFITQQVGGRNDRELVEMVLPGTKEPFPHANLAEQRQAFENAGFLILRAEETFRPIRFYDIGAFVWFARIIEWEFPGFSVDRCFKELLKMQKETEEKGFVEGTIHRYLIIARKLPERK